MSFFPSQPASATVPGTVVLDAPNSLPVVATITGALNTTIIQADGTLGRATVDALAVYVISKIPATAYSTTLSSVTGVTASPVTVTFTPISGSWPAGEVITPASTVAGTFNPTTITATGTGAVTTTFTPSAAGTASITTTTAPAITSTTGAITYAVTAPPVAVATAYTTVVSPTTSTVNTNITITFTPTGGAWPAGEVITLTSNGTTVTTVSPTGSAPISATTMVSTAGAYTINSTTAPAITNTTGAITYTATAVAVATAYTLALSGTTGASGAPVTLTFTPTGGSWPAGEVITPAATVAGTFNPTTVAASGTVAGTSVFTPSATGTASITSTTAPGMANPAAATYTVTAAAASGYPLTFAGTAGATPSGNAALTQLDSVVGIATATLDGSGGLQMPTVANAKGYFANAGMIPAFKRVTVTYAAGSTNKEINIVICADGANSYYMLSVTAGGYYYINKVVNGVQTQILNPTGPVPTTSVTFYTDTGGGFIGLAVDGIGV